MESDLEPMALLAVPELKSKPPCRSHAKPNYWIYCGLLVSPTSSSHMRVGSTSTGALPNSAT